MQTSDSVIVVTGASSGIGRATARLLAEQGARLVLVARDADALADVAAECSSGGWPPLVCPVDVSDAEAVEAVGQAAVERFGRIDGWVNSASVMTFGAFLDVPLDDVRRVLDVDVMGYVHGCRTALRRMVEQGTGVVVNVSSILGVVALPYGTSYSMAKFAIRGLSVSLRQELRLAGIRGVDVCTVLPSAVDTPIWNDAGNHTGRRPRALPPVVPPERVARVIVRRLRSPRRETVVGGVAGHALVWQHAIWPGSAERVLAFGVDGLGLTRSAGQPATSGNLYEPAPGPGHVHGGWQTGRRRRRVALAAVGALTASALWARHALGTR